MKITRVPHSGNVDLSDWELGSIPDLKSMVLKAATEALQIIFDDGEIDLSFPFIWSDDDGIDGPSVDPLTVYIRIPLSDGLDEPPTLSFNLKDLVDELLETCNGNWSEDEPRILRGIRDGLRGLADRIDSAIIHKSE